MCFSTNFKLVIGTWISYNSKITQATDVIYNLNFNIEKFYDNFVDNLFPLAGV